MVRQSRPRAPFAPASHHITLKVQWVLLAKLVILQNQPIPVPLSEDIEQRSDGIGRGDRLQEFSPRVDVVESTSDVVREK